MALNYDICVYSVYDLLAITETKHDRDDAENVKKLPSHHEEIVQSQRPLHRNNTMPVG